MRENVVRKNTLKDISLDAGSFVKALDYYYVDKTLLIKHVLGEDASVSVITRPRSFGKSLNLDMLKTFFEKTDEDNSVYFKGKKIWTCGERYTSRQGMYPVIYLSFSKVTSTDYDGIWGEVRDVISAEFRRHAELLEDDSLHPEDIEDYIRVAKGQASREDYLTSLGFLSRLLEEHYHIEPVILMDDCNTPAQNAYMGTGYDSVLDIMDSIYANGLEGNQHLSFAVVTDVLPVMLPAYSSTHFKYYDWYLATSQEYEADFGFTDDEVKSLLAYYGVEDRYDEVRRLYGGYQIYNTDLFSPESVLGYVQRGCVYDAESTAEDLSRLGDCIRAAKADVAGRLAMLESGYIVPVQFRTWTGLSKYLDGSDNFLSLMVHAGYLSNLGRDCKHMGVQDYPCSNTYALGYYDLKVPNRVANNALQRACGCMDLIPEDSFRSIQRDMESFDARRIARTISTCLKIYYGQCGLYSESFNEFTAFFCRNMSRDYIVDTKLERTTGHLNISLEPIDHSKSGIIFRITEPLKTKDSLIQTAKAILCTAVLNGYDSVMYKNGITDVVMIGVAYRGTSVKADVAFCHKCSLDANSC